MVLKSAQDRVLALEQRHQALLVQANGEINLLQQKVTSLEKGEDRATNVAHVQYR